MHFKTRRKAEKNSDPACFCIDCIVDYDTADPIKIRNISLSQIKPLLITIIDFSCIMNLADLSDYQKTGEQYAD